MPTPIRKTRPNRVRARRRSMPGCAFSQPENHSIPAARTRPPLKHKPVPVARMRVGNNSGK